jgi:DNA-binding NarL/FixJ family response regulator
MKTTQPTKVFIVDDSAPIRTRIGEMLGTVDGIELVGEAASAREAIAGISGSRPDSVVLDLNLPDASGMEVLRTFRPVQPEIVFVVLTNHSEPQYRHACHRAGAAFFFDKSSEFDRVREVIEQIASTRH